MNNAGIDILLIEDSPSDAEMTIRVLKKNNIAANIVHINNGISALDFLFGTGEYSERNTGHKPRVILLDLKMPKVNGIEILKKIKSDNRTKKIPVVVLTSSKENTDLEQSYLLGVNSYIVKPVDFEEFSKAITELGIYWMVRNQIPHTL